MLDETSAAEVSRNLGVSRGSVFNWLARYRKGGRQALATRPRSGRPRKIDDEELLAVAKMIVEPSPLELGCPLALWSRDIICEMVRARIQGEISRWSISRLLGHLGLVPQRPDFRAWEKDPDQVRRWVSRQFPALKAYAKRIRARIFLVDEAPIRADTPIGRVWVNLGRESATVRCGEESICTMISAIPPSGSLRFMVSNRRLTSSIFREFLDRLMTHEDRPVMLITARHSALATGVTRRYIEKFGGRLLLYVIPSYDPDFNPYEHVSDWIESVKFR